jgi:TPR repeat protein
MNITPFENNKKRKEFDSTESNALKKSPNDSCEILYDFDIDISILSGSELVSLGIEYYNGCNEKIVNLYKARKLFEIAVSKYNDPEGQLYLGIYYETGKGGVIKNLPKAFELYEKSSAQGCAHAQYNLGIFYTNGIAVEKSELKALSLFQSAANSGFGPALHSLGLFYEEGYANLPVDHKEANKYYMQAILKKNIKAVFNLGINYGLGRGIEKNARKARICYEIASGRGHLQSMYNLAKMLQIGEGTPKNMEKAFTLFKKAGDLGHIASRYMVGLCYNYGSGVEKDINKANDYLS